MLSCFSCFGRAEEEEERRLEAFKQLEAIQAGNGPTTLHYFLGKGEQPKGFAKYEAELSSRSSSEQEGSHSDVTEMGHRPGPHIVARQLHVRAEAPSSHRSHMSPLPEGGQPSSRHSTPLTSARDHEQSAGGAYRAMQPNSSGHCSAAARAPAMSTSTSLHTTPSHASSRSASAASAASQISRTPGSAACSRDESTGSLCVQTPPVCWHGGPGLATPSSHTPNGAPRSWKSLHQIQEHAKEGCQAEEIPAHSACVAGSDAGVTLLYTPRSNGGAQARNAAATGSCGGSSCGSGDEAWVVGMAAGGLKGGHHAGRAQQGTDKPSDSRRQADLDAGLGTEPSDLPSAHSDRRFGSDASSSCSSHGGADSARDRGGDSVSISPTPRSDSAADTRSREAECRLGAAYQPARGAGPSRSPSQPPAAAAERTSCGSGTGGNQYQEPARRCAAGPSPAAGPSARAAAAGAAAPCVSQPCGAAGAAAGSRASPFVPLYGAPRRTRTPPPPGGYSSASTRLALHDVLSHRSNRSRVGGSVVRGSISVSQMGGDVDFRPRWRY